jgi:hypothetical protein
MKPIVRTLPLALVIGAAAVSLGQETPPSPPAAPPASTPASPPAQSAREPGKPVDDGEFIPSEEISADEAVTFPVDI